jgi:hypothetical protein
MKLPFSVEEFREMLDEALEPEDKKLLYSYFLSYDNDNLFRLLEKKESELEKHGILSHAELEEVIRQVKEGDTIENKQVPPYFEKTVRAWLDEEIPGHLKTLEDLISSLYADYGMEVKNSLISGWFEMNLNIGNILAAIFARKYGMVSVKWLSETTKLPTSSEKMPMHAISVSAANLIITMTSCG